MTSTDRTEEMLRTAVAVPLPPDAARLLDERIARLTAATPASRRRLRGRLLRPLVLAAVVAMVAGASGSILGLYDLLGGAGYQVAWTRGARLELAQVVGDYRVTLHRAYADANELMVALSVSAETTAGLTQVDVRSAQVTDETAAEFRMTGGGSSPAGRTEAANVFWYRPMLLPLPPGLRHFHVAVPAVGVRDASSPPPADTGDWDPWHEVAGPWTFEFDLDVAGGMDLRPQATAETGGVTIGIDRVVTSPTSVLVTLRLAGLPARDWAPIVEIAHNGRTLVGGAGGGLEPGLVELATSEGVDDATGRWSVVVTELVGDDAGGQVRVTGPWRLEFSVP